MNKQSRAFHVLIAAIAMRAIVPSLVNYWTATHAVVSDGTVVAWSSSARTASLVTTASLFAACAWSLNQRASAGTRLTRRVALLLLVLVVYYFRDTRSDLSTTNTYLDIATLLITVLAIVSAQPRLTDMKVFAYVGGVVCAYSLLFGIISPAHAYMIDAQGPTGLPAKAIIGGELLAGPMSHSNTLGIFAALCAPFALLIRKRTIRFALIALLSYTAMAAASRTSLIALGIGLLFVGFSRAIGSRFRINFAAAILVLTTLVAALLPFQVVDGSALSGRGEVWRRALGAYQGSGDLLVGVGSYWGSDGLLIGDSGLRPTSSSGHNLLVQWLVVGGLLLAAMGLMLIIGLIRQAIRLDSSSRSPVATTYCLLLLVISATEFIWVPSVASQVFPVTVAVMAAFLSHNVDGNARIPSPPEEQLLPSTRPVYEVGHSFHHRPIPAGRSQTPTQDCIDPNEPSRST